MIAAKGEDLDEPRPKGLKLALATQATLIAGGCSVVMYAAALAWAAAGADPWLVLLIPLVGGCAGVYLYTRHTHRVRIGALHRAFERLMAGDFDHDLPEALDAESVPLQRAWARMRRSIRDMTANLKRVDASRRQLFSDLAHELGTPVGTVLALADGLALPEVEAHAARRAELLHALVAEGARLSRLVGDLRDLAELDDPEVALSPVPVDVAAMTRDIVTRTQLANPSRAHVAHDEPGTLVAEVDPERFEQVVVNILSNAMRYTPDDGKISISLQSRDGALELDVADSGTGVPEELLGVLGERLVRLDPSRSRRTGGSGLGLSIVRSIVGRHGGEIHFRRAPLGGLGVRIRLPLVQPVCAD